MTNKDVDFILKFMASDKNADGKYQNMVIEYNKIFDDFFYYTITKKGILVANSPQSSLKASCGSNHSFSSNSCVNAVINFKAMSVHNYIYICMSKRSCKCLCCFHCWSYENQQEAHWFCDLILSYGTWCLYCYSRCNDSLLNSLLKILD